MTSTEKQYWAGEFTDAELDAAADAGEHAKRLDALADAGTRVIIHYGRSAAEASTLLTEIRAAGGRAEILSAGSRGLRAGLLAEAQPGCIGRRFSRLLSSGPWEHIPKCSMPAATLAPPASR